MYFHDEGSAHLGHNNQNNFQIPFQNERVEFSFGKADRKGKNQKI